MNTMITVLHTPCGDISVTDEKGTQVPFLVEKNLFDHDYHIHQGTSQAKAVNTDTNFCICVDVSSLKIGVKYSIRLSGTKLAFGDSDERTECVSGNSNGYSIALGAYSPNDDEKMYQAYAYSEERGFLKHRIIRQPPTYDESKFSEYDVEMLEDYSGFEFHLIEEKIKRLDFLVAWIENKPGEEDEYEGAVQFWTT